MSTIHYLRRRLWTRVFVGGISSWAPLSSVQGGLSRILVFWWRFQEVVAWYLPLLRRVPSYASGRNTFEPVPRLELTTTTSIDQDLFSREIFLVQCRLSNTWLNRKQLIAGGVFLGPTCPHTLLNFTLFIHMFMSQVGLSCFGSVCLSLRRCLSLTSCHLQGCYLALVVKTNALRDQGTDSQTDTQLYM